MTGNPPIGSHWARTGGQPRIAVIGAGMSGIGAVIKLEKAGYTDVTVFEKTGEIGGTWRENRYPGLSCDVPSYFYQYTFAPNPDWSHRFSYGPEIQAYLKRTAERFGVMPRIRFNAPVTELRYEAPRWHLRAGDGEAEVFDIVIAATGVLHHPSVPDFPGLDDFRGTAFHTARWPENLDLTGKKVGIIGTGSTSAQIVGAITDQVARVSLFQRTAQWIHPLPQKRYGERWKGLLRRIPALNRAAYRGVSFTIDQTFVRATLGSPVMLRYLAWMCRRNLRRNVPDPELRAKLTPDYRAGCKRMIFCSTFYPAISKDNAELVTAGIDRIEADGVRTADGTLHELDVLVLATGFKASNFILPTRVIGENGVELGSQWDGIPRAHRATTMPGFPNFWMLEGPTGPVGNISLFMISEQQIDNLILSLDEMRAREAVAMAPRQDAFERYNADMARAVRGTIWFTGGCNSWYLDRNGVPNIYPWAPRRFRREMQNPDFSEFRFMRDEAEAIAADRAAAVTA
ncbi:flavin-containing monooxygenase [Algiphilus sp.]|uniref:flavin-containing monooxygenase n=1 Tax=Algiphilus sp. TaxID=1872431 RepID=UPI003C43814B